MRAEISDPDLDWVGAAAVRDGARPPHPWPLAIIGLAAGIALWSGWVELGKLTGFGLVTPLPGILDDFQLNSAIVLPMSGEAYAAYAVRVWLATAWLSERTRQFSKWSVAASLLIGGFAQVASHLMTEYGMTSAPWWVTVLVASVPVLMAGLAAGLAQMVHQDTARGRSVARSGDRSAGPGVVPAPYRQAVALLMVIPAPVVRQALVGSPDLTPELVGPPPELANLRVLDAGAGEPVASPGVEDTAINLPLATLEEARKLITSVEEAGGRVTRSMLVDELSITPHYARLVKQEFSRFSARRQSAANHQEPARA